MNELALRPDTDPADRSASSAPVGAVGERTPSVTASVLICCYTLDRWDDLDAAIESALAQRPAPDEVVVVVDHHDELLARLRERWADRAVVITPSTGRQGLSGARNTGLDVVTGDVVVFLDDDARASDGWLAAHLSAYADPDVLGVGGRIEPAWDTGRPAWFPHDFDWVIGCTHTGVPNTVAGPDGTERAAIRNPIGANMSFRTGALREAGGFSESLGREGTVPLGCEETEASIRVAQRHPTGHIWYLPAATVEHRVIAARGTWSYFWHRCVAEGRSKATVRSLSAEPLGTERAYATRILPRSFGRALVAGARGERGGFGRAGAIAGGLGLTAYGFAAASAEARVRAYRTRRTKK